MDIFKKFASIFFDLLEVVVVALAIFVVCYLFLFQPHEVNGSSMEPNFHNKEFLLTDKVTYRFRSPTRGDVIVFRSRNNREQDYIKRIIGLPGEKVKVLNDHVFINDQRLSEPYLQKDLATYQGSFLRSGEDFLIPPDEYIVMGDNRLASSDSREWGTVVKDDITGKAWLIYWPPQDFGVLAKVKY
ncbi:MAG: signal peptidase I [Candidatus Gottesmanbacteria bacterium]